MLEDIFEEITAKNAPNLGKKTDIQVQEAQSVPSKMDPKRSMLRHIIIKISKIKDKEGIFFFFFFFFGPYLWHVEVPRLWVKLEVQLLVYTRATTLQDLSRVCNLHHSSWKCQILNPLSKARTQTHNLMVPSRIRFHCATRETPEI